MILNHAFVRRWVRALRSGNYRQGRGALHSIDNEYCCLGVECDLVDPTGWTSDGSGTQPYYGFRNPFQTLFPPLDVAVLSGVPTWFRNELANLNDGTGRYQADGPASFAEIADVLELALAMDRDGALPATEDEAYGLSD